MGARLSYDDLMVPDGVREVISGIEVFAFGWKATKAAPVVFVTHGRTGAVADVFGYCRELVASGLVAIAIEQRNHGRRLFDPAANQGWSPHSPSDMYGIILGTALDISLLIDMIPARLGLSTEVAGVTGVSLGGHVTLMAMAMEPRLAAGAALIGAGDYRRLMERRAEANGVSESDFASYFPEALQQAVDRYDPIHHGRRFSDRPLLMANGSDDTLVPSDCNEGLERALRPHYSDHERLRLHVYEGVAHEVPDEMQRESVEWLARWLSQVQRDSR